LNVPSLCEAAHRHGRRHQRAANSRTIIGRFPAAVHFLAIATKFREVSAFAMIISLFPSPSRDEAFPELHGDGPSFLLPRVITVLVSSAVRERSHRHAHRHGRLCNVEHRRRRRFDVYRRKTSSTAAPTSHEDTLQHLAGLRFFGDLPVDVGSHGEMYANAHPEARGMASARTLHMKSDPKCGGRLNAAQCRTVQRRNRP